jgi:hypothetical protein
MAIITIPSELKWTSAELDFYANLISNVGQTGVSQRVINPGSRWGLKFSLPPMSEEQSRFWRSFLMAQKGGANEFTFGPPGYDGTSYAGADPIVNGASQTGVSLVCDGVSNSETILKDGEYFSVGYELKTVIGDAVSDGSGNVTIVFEPMLRESPADNVVLEIQAPKAKFMLANPTVGFSYSLSNIQQMKSINAIEVIDA